MSSVANAVIAAAGLGSRLGFGIPKAMIEIESKTLLSRLILNLERDVANIHVVIGCREELLTEHCEKYHRNVVLVRNPEYRTTNTAQSYAMGALPMRGKTLFLDGDLLIHPQSLASFLRKAASHDVLIGLTDAKSENAVFVKTEQVKESGEDDILVTEFTRSEQSDLEWANVVAGPSDLLHSSEGFVFETLNGFLPCQGEILQLAEVDTPDDLENAVSFAKSHGL